MIEEDIPQIDGAYDVQPSHTSHSSREVAPRPQFKTTLSHGSSSGLFTSNPNLAL